MNISIPYISFYSYLVNKLATSFYGCQHYTANRAAQQQLKVNFASGIIRKFASHCETGFLYLLLMESDENQHRSRLLVSVSSSACYISLLKKLADLTWKSPAMQKGLLLQQQLYIQNFQQF